MNALRELAARIFTVLTWSTVSCGGVGECECGSGGPGSGEELRSGRGDTLRRFCRQHVLLYHPRN